MKPNPPPPDYKTAHKLELTKPETSVKKNVMDPTAQLEVDRAAEEFNAARKVAGRNGYTVERLDHFRGVRIQIPELEEDEIEYTFTLRVKRPA